MNGKSIFFIVIGRYSTGKLIFNVADKQDRVNTYKDEAQKVLNQLINIGLNPHERQKVNSSYGNWYTTVDDKDIAYLVLSTSDYPERYAYEISDQIKNNLSKMGDYSNEDDSSIKFNSQDIMKESFKKYSNLESISKIEKAQNQIDTVRDIVSNDLGKMLQNQTNLTILDDKSKNLNQQSNIFLKQSKDLERLMYWRNLKLKIILGLVFLGVVAYLCFPLFNHFFVKKDEEKAKQ